MEPISVIIGIITLACFIVPVLYYQGVQKRKRKEFLKNFIGVAQQEQVMVTEYDFWNHGYAIGIDRVKNQLFYLKKKEGKEQKILIDLNVVDRCSLVNQNRLVGDNRTIDRLSLVFSYRNAKHPEKELEFYNKEESMSLNDELQLLEKWKSLVNTKLVELSGLTAKGMVEPPNRTAA